MLTADSPSVPPSPSRWSQGLSQNGHLKIQCKWDLRGQYLQELGRAQKWTMNRRIRGLWWWANGIKRGWIWTLHAVCVHRSITLRPLICTTNIRQSIFLKKERKNAYSWEQSAILISQARLPIFSDSPTFLEFSREKTEALLWGLLISRPAFFQSGLVSSKYQERKAAPPPTNSRDPIKLRGLPSTSLLL